MFDRYLGTAVENFKNINARDKEAAFDNVDISRERKISNDQQLLQLLHLTILLGYGITPPLNDYVSFAKLLPLLHYLLQQLKQVVPRSSITHATPPLIQQNSAQMAVQIILTRKDYTKSMYNFLKAIVERNKVFGIHKFGIESKIDFKKSPPLLWHMLEAKDALRSVK